MHKYRSQYGGFTLSVPPEWEAVEDPEHATLVLAEPTRGEQWFRASLVVTTEPLGVPASLIRWHEEALATMHQRLPGLVLIDIDETRLAGRPARRLLAHHRSDRGGSLAAVAMEQWRLMVGASGYTLTASAAALEYHDFAGVFTEMVNGFRPGPRS